MEDIGKLISLSWSRYIPQVSCSTHGSFIYTRSWDSARSTRLVVAIKNLYALWYRKYLLPPVTYILPKTEYPIDCSIKKKIMFSSCTVPVPYSCLIWWLHKFLSFTLHTYMYVLDISFACQRKQLSQLFQRLSTSLLISFPFFSGSSVSAWQTMKIVVAISTRQFFGVASLH